MPQKKWRQQEQKAIGIQPQPPFLTLATLGSYAGATTAVVRALVCSTSAAPMAVRIRTARLAPFWVPLVLWTDEKRNSLNRSTTKEKVK